MNQEALAALTPGFTGADLANLVNETALLATRRNADAAAPRAAEKLVFDDLSTGAAGDLAEATDVARSMVARFGMDEGLGSVSYETDRSALLGPVEGQTYLERKYSEATAQRIDGAVKRVIDQAFARSLALLRANRAVLEEGARRLLESETLDEEALRDLAKGLVGCTIASPRIALPARRRASPQPSRALVEQRARRDVSSRCSGTQESC